MPPLELSDDMYQRLIGLITEARVSAQAACRETVLMRNERDRDYAEVKSKIDGMAAGYEQLSQTVCMMVEGFRAIEEDLNQVQKAIRDHAQSTSSMALEVHGMAQSLDGITQLTKSNFDQLESFRKQVIDGEASGRISIHGEEASGRSQ